MHPSRRILKLRGCRKPALRRNVVIGCAKPRGYMLEKLLLPDNHAIAILMNS
jgi:hypothetical protein